MEWFASSIAGSTYSLAFSVYTLRYLDQIHLLDWLPASYKAVSIKIMAVIIALFFLYINYRGASETGKIGAVFTLGQTLFMLFIGVIGVIAQAGDEAIEPRKNLPKAMIYFATRASYALGRDRMLPGFFAKISKKRKTPWVALLFTGSIIILIVILIVILIPKIEDITSSASIMFLFLFFLVNICAIWIRLNMSDELIYGFLMPLFPLFPILAILSQAVLAVWLVHLSMIFIFWRKKKLKVFPGIRLWQH